MVKIEKKRGIEKIKITHNKKLLYVIIALIILLIILIFIILTSKPENNLPKECLNDNDCYKIQTGCCTCNMGGEEKCVNKSQKIYYQEQVKNCSLDKIMCAAFYNCNINSCGCVNNKCTK